MTVGELKKQLEGYPDDMEVEVEGALGYGFTLNEVKPYPESVNLYSSYIVSMCEDALGEDL